MIVVTQQVEHAKLTVENETISEIGGGLLTFVGIGRDDNLADVNLAASKLIKTRQFKDQNGKINLNPKDSNAHFLIVSNFTLQADLTHGNRPNFSHAGEFETAKELFNALVNQVKESGAGLVKTGVFGAHMQIETKMIGPINLVIDTKKL